MSFAHEHGGNIFAIARSLGVNPEKILDFSASINPLGMAPAVREAIIASFDKLLHYPDKGASELKEKLAAYHGVDPGEVAVANGSTELIHLMPQVAKGKKGLIVAPAFAEYAFSLQRGGWEIDYFTLPSSDRFTLSLPALREKLREQYDLLFICNPANPTGSLVSRGEIEQVVELCRQSGTFLVLDEAFMDFCEEESAKQLIRRTPRAVLLRSMTKFFAIPGLRLGYAIGRPETVAAISSLQDPWSVNTAAQVAGIASLSDPGYVERTRSYIENERSSLADGLESLEFLRVFPSRANYLLAEIVTGFGAAELRTRLMRKGILIRDCGNFHGLDGRFFRMAVKLREENEVLLDELRGMASTPSSPRPSTCEGEGE
jgi:threonine-phosphate decarboxylase